MADICQRHIFTNSSQSHLFGTLNGKVVFPASLPGKMHKRNRFTPSFSREMIAFPGKTEYTVSYYHTHGGIL